MIFVGSFTTTHAWLNDSKQSASYDVTTELKLWIKYI